MQNLRQGIGNTTRNYKVLERKVVTRVFYVPVNGELEDIESWYKNWFPAYDIILDKIYSWIKPSMAQSKDDLVKTIGLNWRNAMSASTVKDLTSAGYRLLDSSSQIIFLIDLTKDGGLEKLREIKSVFDNFIEQWGSLALFHFNCIAILKNYNESTDQPVFPTDLNGFINWGQSNLDRLFLVDSTNSQGTLISCSTDLNFLLGQMVYFLTRKPIQSYDADGSDRFNEWVGTIDFRKGFFTAFSAISIVFPIDYVLEICLVNKGAGLLNESIFSIPSEDRRKYYFNSIITENNFQTYDTLREKITSGKNQEYIIDPLKLIWKTNKEHENSSMVERIEEKLALYNSINSRIPEYIDSNKVFLESQISNVSLNFTYSLQNITDKVIGSEKGSGMILESMLKDLKNHFRKLIPEDRAKHKEQDILKLIDKLGKEKTKVPTGESIIVWISMVFGMLAFNVFWMLGSLDVFKITSAAILLMVAGFLAFHWFAVKSRTRKLIIRIEAAIGAKWQHLMNEVTDSVISQIMAASQKKVEESEIEIGKVLNRFREIIHFGQEIYDTDHPVESAFWINAVSNRNEAKTFTRKIKDIQKLKPLNILCGKSSLELWNRISFTEGQELNLWEIELLEKSALEYISELHELLAVSVCEVLMHNRDRFENLKILLSRYSDPFINLSSLYYSGKDGFFEFPRNNCDQVAELLCREIENNIHLERKESESNFRLSFFSFADGIKIKDITDTFK